MKLYTKTICPKCMWIKSELQKAGIVVEEFNIDQNQQAKQFLISAGFLTVPVLEFEGQLIGDVKAILSQIELVAQ
ncbi:MAG TPA: glutaredoxin [Ureibacillus sp.]|nr:glutaredoxin [Ureibacillus sp.]